MWVVGVHCSAPPHFSSPYSTSSFLDLATETTYNDDVSPKLQLLEMSIGLEEAWQNLTLTEYEEKVVIIDDEEDNTKEEQIALRLLGRLHMEIFFNARAMKPILRNIAEEKRLFSSFQKAKANSSARTKLTFDNSTYDKQNKMPDSGCSKTSSTSMIIETKRAVEVGAEAFKHKQSDMKFPKASDCKIRIIEKQSEASPSSNVQAESNLPWLVGGDLNEIFYHGEKKGGPPKTQATTDNFQSYFIDNGLFDLECSRYDFTWSNYQENGAIVEE
ncbi:hypothetical protein Cgig2_026663 [Carnegiea gigantea]|uniref:Uncharacterized protein n=1 Tax=Carnegiea gigantea TaxID=171969 RepID=A0A9Q1JV10_9CARY|nr:hypothetical protein Cgig2_026663 [Carnegiea gigantea]